SGKALATARAINDRTAKPLLILLINAAPGCISLDGFVVIPIIVAWKKMTETHFLSDPIHIYFV
ncbi:MAG TPA: hypothetical protein VN089_20065, partial [Duganella sp.]|nr:hypothetical protein [Duganella sp.]